MGKKVKAKVKQLIKPKIVSTTSGDTRGRSPQSIGPSAVYPTGGIPNTPDIYTPANFGSSDITKNVVSSVPKKASDITKNVVSSVPKKAKVSVKAKSVAAKPKPKAKVSAKVKPTNPKEPLSATTWANLGYNPSGYKAYLEKLNPSSPAPKIDAQKVMDSIKVNTRVPAGETADTLNTTAATQNPAGSESASTLKLSAQQHQDYMDFLENINKKKKK